MIVFRRTSTGLLDANILLSFKFVRYEFAGSGRKRLFLATQKTRSRCGATVLPEERVSEMDDDARRCARLILSSGTKMRGEIIDLDQAERDERHGLDIDAAANRRCKRVC